MIAPSWIEIGLYLAVLLLLIKPLGLHMARVLEGERTWASRLLGPLERLCYRVAGVSPDEPMGWRRYALAMLCFNVAGLFAVTTLPGFTVRFPVRPVMGEEMVV